MQTEFRPGKWMPFWHDDDARVGVHGRAVEIVGDRCDPREPDVAGAASHQVSDPVGRLGWEHLHDDLRVPSGELADEVRQRHRETEYRGDAHVTGDKPTDCVDAAAGHFRFVERPPRRGHECIARRP